MAKLERSQHGWAKVALLLWATLAAIWLPTNAHAYLAEGRWSVTASGTSGSIGTPIMLTWSLVPDGTSIRSGGASNLIEYFDGLFNVDDPSGDLTQRPWFGAVEASFERWNQLSGITFTYEPHDDAASMRDSGGVLGLRGDVRIGGTVVDGPGGTLAYSSFPDSGDLIVDTSEIGLFANPANNYRQLRNVLMHEIGHAIGLEHIESSTDALLMEPSTSNFIDGPQLDDIRGIQALYGDPLEKGNGGLGNDAPQRATGLGALSVSDDLMIGADAVGGQVVDPAEIDFVSIASFSDVDYYSFTVASPVLLNATLTPLGGIFSQGLVGGTQLVFDANSRSNLALAVLADDGTTVLRITNDAAAGHAEMISDFDVSTAGTYFVRVTGSAVHVQPYQLQLSASASSPELLGDYNRDGAVDASDFVVWKKAIGQSGFGLSADGNDDGIVDERDYDVWRANFGAVINDSTNGSAPSINVPEPSPGLLVSAAALLLVSATRGVQRVSSSSMRNAPDASA